MKTDAVEAPARPEAPVEARPAGPPTPEVLIPEARRYQRRRHLRVAAAAVTALAVALLVIVTVTGSSPPPAARRPTASHHPAAAVVTARPLGRATTVQLSGPIGVAAAAGGLAYFSDGDSLYRVDLATEQLSRVARFVQQGPTDGGAAAVTASPVVPNTPTGVAVAPDGDVYVATGDRVRRLAGHGLDAMTVTVVAGTGRPGSSGDDGPATRATLRMEGSASGGLGLAQGIAVGPDGSLYIADQGNDRVRRVSPNGDITTVAGDGRAGEAGDGGPATQASLCPPVGVAVDRTSDLFIATACGSVRAVSGRTGIIETVFGAGEAPGVAGSAGDHDPLGLAASADGRQLYVTEAYGRRLLDVDLATGAVRLVAGTGMETSPPGGHTAGDGGPAAAATFGLPLGIATEQNGDILVADFFNNAVRQFDVERGTIGTVAGVIPTVGHCC